MPCQHVDPTGQDRDCPCPDNQERYCAVCGEPEGSPYAKHCCTDDNMIEA